MPVSIPTILETQTLAIASCDTMNLDTGDIANTGKSTAGQTDYTSQVAQIEAIEASGTTFKTLGDLTQLINPIVSELNSIVNRINQKLLPYENKVDRATEEEADIANSNSWYASAINYQQTIQSDAQTVINGLDPADPGYGDAVAAQQSIIDAATAQIDDYNAELVILGDYETEWANFKAYHQAVINDIVSNFNTIMSPVRSAFLQAKTAIETSNTNITSGKDRMLDGAAEIATIIAKTASAAVTQAIGDIAENSSIMKEIAPPVGGGSGVTGHATFRGARDTAQFIGAEWDGSIPSHVEIVEEMEYAPFINYSGEYATHVFQPGTEHRARRHLLRQPIYGKIDSYPIRLDNRFILGQEEFSHVPSPAINSPGWVSRGGAVMVGWMSDTPGGPPRLGAKGEPVVYVYNDIETYIEWYQVYSLTDMNTSIDGKWEPKRYLPEYSNALVFPVITKTYFWNMANVSPETSLRIRSPSSGIPATKNNIARAPTVDELVTIEDVNSYWPYQGYPAFLWRSRGYNLEREFDEAAGRRPDYETFDEYIERNNITVEPPVTGIISGEEYNDAYNFQGNNYKSLPNPYNYLIPTELTPGNIVGAAGYNKSSDGSFQFSNKMSIPFTVPPVSADDNYSEEKVAQYGKISWSSNTFIYEGAEQASRGTYALVTWVSDLPGGPSRGIGNNYDVSYLNTDYFNDRVLINDTKYWQAEYDYFDTVNYPLSQIGNSVHGAGSVRMDLINPTGNEAEIRFVNFALVKNDNTTFTDRPTEYAFLGQTLSSPPGSPTFNNFIATAAYWTTTRFGVVASYPDSVYIGTRPVISGESKQFKNVRQVNASPAAGNLKNIRFDVLLGQFELIEEPNSNTTFGDKKFSMVRVPMADLVEFFNPNLTEWNIKNTDFFLKYLKVDDSRIVGTARFAPARENGQDILYRFREVGGAPYNSGNAIKQGNYFEENGVGYFRLLIYHDEDQGYPNTHNTISKDESFGPMRMYTPTNYYFGYLDAGDVEGVDYLPWQEIKNSYWGTEKFVDDDIWVSTASGISVNSSYHHSYLKVARLQHVFFAGQPAYRIFFEYKDDKTNAFSGTFDSSVDLFLAQEKTAEEIADEAAEDDIGSLGAQPFIATDGVLTYDTEERATADFRAGIYKNERLIRINNFRRSLDVALGELFIVAGTDWIPVNEWEEAWRRKTGSGVDVESAYNVINNVTGLRQPPLDVDGAKPSSMPVFQEPPKVKKITVGDREISLGPMEPLTDLIAGADAHERATKKHLEAIEPFQRVVETDQKEKTKATAGLGGFDKDKVAAKKLADAVAVDVTKEVTVARLAKEKAEFDFKKVTAVLTSNNATGAANIAKTFAEAGTSLMSSARADIIPACGTAFPESETLIARAEPPTLPDITPDITSGARINT